VASKVEASPVRLSYQGGAIRVRENEPYMHRSYSEYPVFPLKKVVTGDRRSSAVVIASNLSLAQLLLSTSTCRRVLPELLNQTSLTDQPPKSQAETRR
jgi:hypothetical protein